MQEPQWISQILVSRSHVLNKEEHKLELSLKDIIHNDHALLICCHIDLAEVLDTSTHS